MPDVKFPQIGPKVVAKIIETKGHCTIGMKPGDEFELSTHKCGDFCGLFYKNIKGWVQTLQFGGTFPAGSDLEVQVSDWPNLMNRVQFELRRVDD